MANTHQGSQMSTISSLHIAFLGGGNMAQALALGLRAHVHSITIIEPLEDTRERIRVLMAPKASAQGASLQVVASAEVIEDKVPADWLVLAVKPQQIASALGGLSDATRRWLGAPPTLSILAGTTLATLSSLLGHARIVRAMPNTPALISEGMTALVASAEISTEQRIQAEALMRAVGQVQWVENEALLDAVTALSGSGPAYVFAFVEALVQAGERLGLPPHQAQMLASQTVKGAALMLSESGDLPSALRERVTSKGGTTAAALATLQDGGFNTLIERALRAAYQRSIEISQGA